jgi:uncharacterized protein YbjQ (UPF0145 family)
MMLVTTTWNVAGHRVRETRGEIFGLIVRTRSLPVNMVAGFRSMFGGEVKLCTNLLVDARQQAIDRMVAKAEAIGANAAVSMRFDASEFSGLMTEILAYGTAVVLEPEPEPTVPEPPLGGRP